MHAFHANQLAKFLKHNRSETGYKGTAQKIINPAQQKSCLYKKVISPENNLWKRRASFHDADAEAAHRPMDSETGGRA